MEPPVEENHTHEVPIACPGHGRPLAEVYFAKPPGSPELLISACHDKVPMLRFANTGDWIGSFEGHKGAVWSAKLDRKTASLAATASGDFTAKLWCAMSGRELHSFTHNHVVKSVDFSPEYDVIATGGLEGKIRIFSLETQQLLHQWDISPSETRIGINKVAFSEPTIIAAGTNDGFVRCVDSRSGQMVAETRVIGSNNAPVMDLQLSADRQTFTAAADNRVSLLSSRDLSVLTTIFMPEKMHFREEGGAALHPNGHKILTGGSDLWVREFSVETGEELCCLKGHHGPVRCVAYPMEGNYFATGSEDGTIRIWKNPQSVETTSST